MTHSLEEHGTEREGPLSLQEIDEIIGTENPPLRNLRITYAYHQLAVALARLLDDRNATWCGFGTWASRTAGLFIRGELKPRPVGLPPVPPWVSRHLMTWAAPHVGSNVARGNLLVFQELGPLFHTMVTAYTEEDDAERALERVLQPLRPGLVTEGGQDLLIAAARSYHRAMPLPHSAARSQVILLANLQVALHEQIRLQEAIAASLAPPLRAPFTPAPLNVLATRFWGRLATSHLMDVYMPAVDFTTTRTLIPLRLGRDVGGAHGATTFCEHLTDLIDLELKALLYDFDRSPNSVLGSAAADWSLLAERMNYLTDFFRLWQQDPCLMQAPFTPRQAEDLRAGKMPSGPPL
ncbi:hypothetical protein SAMN04489712_1047 [Thermomonospora echinospora]|uniref:Uncharacterized protein n=1 Tax=Thermomonospora echinospora TaxID=1992 RepID=A0A1H5YIV6_9ACTN|nr:hypothetical protein [Thermomonospora echinospora]SEG23306.1 hypothetical protein SAMN04489712_1047 [Thermomonospora echinospora]